MHCRKAAGVVLFQIAVVASVGRAYSLFKHLLEVSYAEPKIHLSPHSYGAAVEMAEASRVLLRHRPVRERGRRLFS